MDFDILSAKACITRNGGSILGKQIFHNQPGLKVLAAIDYLCNYNRFTYFKGAAPKGRGPKSRKEFGV